MPTRHTNTGTQSTPTATEVDTWPLAWLLRIELRDLKPAIYREVMVSPDMTLRRLHAVIQAAMGWESAHLYGFAVPGRGRQGRFWGVPSSARIQPPGDSDGMDWMDGEPRRDTAVKLRQVLHAPGDKLLYLYDFGDDWEHLVTLKSVVKTPSALPVLSKAQAGCPPEDCGGPPGYAHWCEAWWDNPHPDHDNARDVLGDEEPGRLDFAALQAAVARLQPRPRAPRTASRSS